MNGRLRTVRRQVSAVARIAAMLMLVGGVTAGRARADVIRVPEDYATIQAAVNASMAGDIVRVGPGTYAERVRISTSGIRLQADGAVLDGSGFTTAGAAIALAGTSTSHVTGVSVVGFRIENQPGAGIDLNFADYCEIRSNEVNNTMAQSIAVARSTFNVIAGNTLSNGTLGVGISMVSSDNTVKENTIAGGFMHGIRVSMVSTTPPTPLRNMIKENFICAQGASAQTGILVAQYATANTVKENRIVGNGSTTIGIRLEGPTLGNTVKENILNGHALDVEDLGTDNRVSENDRHRNLRCPRL